MLAALFGPNDEITAIFYLVAVVLYVLAAFAGGTMGRRTGGAVGLVALGLAFHLFPTMWTTFDAAFGD
ncbi:MAG: hypothetical protein H0V95_11125 [Actinobacteria bacterium]|nr:hypothetical protein [Actinomycetota bacterium]